MNHDIRNVPVGKIYWKKYWEKINIPKTSEKNIEKRYISTKLFEKIILIDLLTTNNKIYIMVKWINSLAIGDKLFECISLFWSGLEGLNIVCVIIWFYLEF